MSMFIYSKSMIHFSECIVSWPGTLKYKINNNPPNITDFRCRILHAIEVSDILKSDDVVTE